MAIWLIVWAHAMLFCAVMSLAVARRSWQRLLSAALINVSVALVIAAWAWARA